MALKTMQVIQLATGRTVTINAQDFDSEKYALEGQAPPRAPATKKHEQPKPLEAMPLSEPKVETNPTHEEVNKMLDALTPKAEEPKPEEEKIEEPPPPPRRRGR